MPETEHTGSSSSEDNASTPKRKGRPNATNDNGGSKNINLKYGSSSPESNPSRLDSPTDDRRHHSAPPKIDVCVEITVKPEVLSSERRPGGSTGNAIPSRTMRTEKNQRARKASANSDEDETEFADFKNGVYTQPLDYEIEVMDMSRISMKTQLKLWKGSIQELRQIQVTQRFREKGARKAGDTSDEDESETPDFKSVYSQLLDYEIGVLEMSRICMKTQLKLLKDSIQELRHIHASHWYHKKGTRKAKEKQRSRTRSKRGGGRRKVSPRNGVSSGNLSDDSNPHYSADSSDEHVDEPKETHMTLMPSVKGSSSTRHDKPNPPTYICLPLDSGDDLPVSSRKHEKVCKIFKRVSASEQSILRACKDKLTQKYFTAPSEGKKKDESSELSSREMAPGIQVTTSTGGPSQTEMQDSSSKPENLKPSSAGEKAAADQVTTSVEKKDPEPSKNVEFHPSRDLKREPSSTEQKDLSRRSKTTTEQADVRSPSRPILRRSTRTSSISSRVDSSSRPKTRKQHENVTSPLQLEREQKDDSDSQKTDKVKDVCICLASETETSDKEKSSEKKRYSDRHCSLKYSHQNARRLSF